MSKWHTPSKISGCSWRAKGCSCWVQVRILYLVSIFPLIIIPPSHSFSQAHFLISTLLSTDKNMSGTAYAVDFTSEQGGQKCEACGASAPPGEKLKYLYNNNRTKSGKHVCAPCRDRYISKVTSRRIEGFSFFFSPTFFVPKSFPTGIEVTQRREIQQEVARAQRGGEIIQVHEKYFRTHRG